MKEISRNDGLKETRRNLFGRKIRRTNKSLRQFLVMLSFLFLILLRFSFDDLGKIEKCELWDTTVS